MTATFVWSPSYTSRRVLKPQLNVMRFGDGYIQVAPAGINPVNRTYDLTFEKITDTEADQIETFLSDNVGLTFYWTPPGEAQASSWLCLGEWSREHVTYNVNRMSLTLEQQGVYRSPGSRLASIWTYDSSDWAETIPSPFALTQTATTAGIAFGGSTAAYATAIVRKSLPPSGDWEINLRMSVNMSYGFSDWRMSLLLGVCSEAFSGVETSPGFAAVAVRPPSFSNNLWHLIAFSDTDNYVGALYGTAPVNVRIRIYRSTQTVQLALLTTPEGWGTTVTKTYTFAEIGGSPTQMFYSAGNRTSSSYTFSTNLRIDLLIQPTLTPL